MEEPVLVLTVRNKFGKVWYLYRDDEEETFYSEGQYGEHNFVTLTDALRYLQDFDVHLDDIFFE